MPLSAHGHGSYDGTRKRQASTAPNRRRRTRGRRRRAAQAAGGGPDAALELSVLMPNSKITSIRRLGVTLDTSGYIKIHARYIKDTCNMMRYMYLKCIHREAERTASRRRRRRRATQGNQEAEGRQGSYVKKQHHFRVKKQHSTLGHLPRHLRHQRQLRRRPRRRARARHVS